MLRDKNLSLGRALPTVKDRIALLNKCLGCVPVIFGAATLPMVSRL